MPLAVVDHYPQAIIPVGQRTNVPHPQEAAIHWCIDWSGYLAPANRTLPLSILDYIVVEIGHIGSAHDKNILADRLAGQRLE
jgi:hypothetical protein